MEGQEKKKKPNRGSRKGKQGLLQQQQVPEPPQPSCSGEGTSQEPKPEKSKHPKRCEDVSQPPQPTVQQTIHREPGPQQIFQPAQPGTPQMRFSSPPGQLRFGGPRPTRPPFSSAQRPPIGPQSPQFQTPTSVVLSETPQQPAVKAWGPKRTSDVPVQKSPQQAIEKSPGAKSASDVSQHPEPGAARPEKQQVARKGRKPKDSRGDSLQLQTCDDSRPLPRESVAGSMPIDQPGNVGQKPAGSRKKQGIAEKPLDEFLNKAFVLESSAEKPKSTAVTTNQGTPGQSSVQAPPKRLGIVKHSSKYFESEKGYVVEVNYLRINVEDIKLKIFQYAVDFEPKNPRSLYRLALKLFFEQNGIDRYPAFDGKALLFAGGTRLRFPNGINAFEGTVTVTDGNSSKEFHIRINLTEELNLQGLMEYIRNGSSFNPFNTQALDLALMNPSINNPNLVKVGRSFYSRPTTPIPLGGGIDLWHGHYQGLVIPWLSTNQDKQHLYLNVDVAHKGFISNKTTVLEFIRKKFFFRDRTISDTNLQRWQLEEAENSLRGLKIDYEVPNQRKISFRVNSLAPGARSARFKPDNQNETTVAEYFRSAKQFTLRYVNLPCLKDSRGRMFPMEFCSLPTQTYNKQFEPNQSRVMVEQSARPTTERKQQIEDSIRNIRFANDPCLEEFGLTMNSTFETVDAYVLKPPTIQYQTRTVPVRAGKWNNDNMNFLVPVNLQKWVLINTDPNVQPNHIRGLVNDFQKAGPLCGVNVSDPKELTLQQRSYTENDFVEVFKEWKNKGASFFMVIMNTRINNIYSLIKRAAELEFYNVGVLTQCLKGENVAKQINNRRFFMTAKNILLKLNAKVSGVNHSLANVLKPEILNDDVMIVGADVTHPAPGSRELSIAAVAASHDKYGFQYNMQYRLQKPKMEIIVDLEEMITQHIEFYWKKTGKMPKRILYYRDGVGEGYFEKVLRAELTAIKRACIKFNAPFLTAVTFVVVQKRHHTRFFPNKANSDGTDNQNVRAGTVIDEKITHPTEVDFFLVSHASLKGTARPTKYRLLYDDSGIDQETLERLTFYLCHMFARCNRSVSYPAPTYYAHLAAFRAKAWWARQPYDEEQLARNQRERGLIRDDVIASTPMFFI